LFTFDAGRGRLAKGITMTWCCPAVAIGARSRRIPLLTFSATLVPDPVLDLGEPGFGLPADRPRADGLRAPQRVARR
jgi:hypothetical protein